MNTKKYISENKELMKEWHPTKNNGIDPNYLKSGSIKNIWWICSKGHEWQAPPNRRSKGTGCPYCNHKKVLVGYNDLLTTHPELKEEWDYEKNNMQPNEVSAGSQKRVWWKCKVCDSRWQTAINNRTGGKGCPKCSLKSRGIKKVVNTIKVNGSLADNNQELLKEWNYSKNKEIVPEEVTTYSKKKVWWICSKGHEWRATIANRSIGTGCPYCKNKRVLAGYNDLLTIYPELKQEWNYEKNIILPTEVSISSQKKVWWKCLNGHDYECKIYDRTHGKNCPICKKL